MPNDNPDTKAFVSGQKLIIRLLEGCFGICRLHPAQSIPDWALSSEFFSITKTPEELSIVCPQGVIPKEADYEPDWSILKVEGPLDFSLTGILSAISTALARQKISIFAISTYDTDYILVKIPDTQNAVQTLIREGYVIIAAKH
jgi:uncharacterized protein